MIYHLNESGDILGISQTNDKVQQLGVVNVESDDFFYPPDHQYINGEFVERTPVSYSLPKPMIEIDETVSVGIPAGSTVTIQGPGFDETAVVDGPFDFQSERMGTYTFSILKYPHRRTNFSIEVI